jgi:hypothetical protein
MVKRLQVTHGEMHFDQTIYDAPAAWAELSWSIWAVNGRHMEDRQGRALLAA